MNAKKDIASRQRNNLVYINYLGEMKNRWTQSEKNSYGGAETGTKHKPEHKHMTSLILIWCSWNILIYCRTDYCHMPVYWLLILCMSSQGIQGPSGAPGEKGIAGEPVSEIKAKWTGNASCIILSNLFTYVMAKCSVLEAI